MGKTVSLPIEAGPKNLDLKGLYIVALGLHGLVRGVDIELGRDADTGGQTLYMVDQARALAARPEIKQVDLITRQVYDRRVDDCYTVPEEWITEGAKISRLPFGPHRYLHKESLWPHLDSLLDQLVRYIRHRRRVPDIIHAHYADAGYVGARLANILGIPFVFTGHSLGRVKQARLLADGLSSDTIETRYHIRTRIEAEERALETASLVIASTNQEVLEQYELYDHYAPQLMEVIPPGVDLDRFGPPLDDWKKPVVADQIRRFLTNLNKPMLLAIARPDERKNFSTLIEAFARTPGLREMANLVLIAGTRDDIAELEAGPRRVLNKILRLVDRYDLYGSVAYPKNIPPAQIPDLYRLAAQSGGLFINPALTEPFGLTLLEAAASGLPVVATADGGPKDITETCRNGVLVDPLDAPAMGRIILESLENEELRQRWAANGVQNVHKSFSWTAHAEHYVRRVGVLHRREGGRPAVRRTRRSMIDRLLICDIDNTITGNRRALAAFRQALEETGANVGFAIATGRTLDRARRVLKRLNLPDVDIAITETGTSIYYGSDPEAIDRSWHQQINHQWYPARVIRALSELPGVQVQPYPDNGEFRIVSKLDPNRAPPEIEVRKHLRRKGLRVTPIFDYGVDLDVIPIRASRGTAIRFLSFKWDLPPERLLIAGDSGNDADMLSGEALGVVVGNHDKALEHLRGQPRIYFADGTHAHGIMEGIEFYDFFGAIRIPEDPSHPSAVVSSA